MIALLTLLVVGQSHPVDRQAVLTAAKSYAEHRWDMSAQNESGSCAPNDYESDYRPGPQVGVPYAWGGAMSLDEFEQRLSKGEAAGSHSRHGVLSCVAGVDCSGFVSKVWRADQRQSTSTMSKISDEIELDDLKPGDAFNKPGKHIVLFAGFNEAGEPTFYEAAGGAAKVRLHSGWSYLSGYTPIRYHAIVDAPAAAEKTDSGGGGVSIALIAAGALAVLGLLGGVVIWRRRRD